MANQPLAHVSNYLKVTIKPLPRPRSLLGLVSVSTLKKSDSQRIHRPRIQGTEGSVLEDSVACISLERCGSANRDPLQAHPRLRGVRFTVDQPQCEGGSQHHREKQYSVISRYSQRQISDMVLLFLWINKCYHAGCSPERRMWQNKKVLR